MAVGTVEDDLGERFATFYRRYYQEDVAELAQGFPKDRSSLYIRFKDLYTYDPDLADDWVDAPGTMRDYAEEGLVRYDLSADVDLSGAHVRLRDPEEYIERLNVSELTSDHLGDYVAITGQLAKVTGVGHRLVMAAYECQRCGRMAEIPQGRTHIQEPHECSGCERQGPFGLSVEDSEFVDQRKLKIEEPPGERSTGQGQSITVYVEDDLCSVGGENGLADRAGEQVTVLGTYHVDESDLNARNASPELGSWVEGNAIEFEKSDYEDIDVEEHRAAFETFAASDDPVDMCARSIAPELDRDEDLELITEASVAWLFNSYRVSPEDKGQYRGDIHMCLIGDPGLGKSTLLTNLSKLAPKCEYRSGTGLSAVGLTAAAVQDDFAGTSEWTLEPGVLPRANGGHCIIDEVDDVVSEKTKKMHDALEGDQMVKVDKAGITADLPTRTALLASGNPTEGRFNHHVPIADQIDLDPALISRMDLLFAMQDEVDKSRDSTKAEHILDAYDELSRSEVQTRNGGDPDNSRTTTDRPVPRDVFRAWIAYARENVHPVLTQEAKERLKGFYIEVRNLNGDHDSDSEEDNPIPATPRTLEAGIRLSTAFARVRLSDTVDIGDAERAIRISRQVVGLNYDPETGEFDAARTDNSTPKSQQDRRQAIVQILEDAAPDDGGLPIDDLLDLAEDRRGMDRQKTKDEVEVLRTKGEIYEPSQGEYRAA